MAFISSSNTSSGKGKVPTASVPTTSSQVSTVSTEVAAASLSHDTICAYIATQSSGSQIKYEDITQIDEDDIEEMDIKWNLVLLSMRANRFWKKTGKKITIQGSDVAGFDKSKVECFNCHKMGHFSRECRALRSQDRGKRESYRKDSKSYMANEDENHVLVEDDVVPTEFALMAMSSSSSSSDNEIIDVSKDVSDEQKAIWKSNSASFSEQGGSVGNVVSKPMIRFVKETGYPSVSKVNNTEKSRKPTVKYAEMYRSQRPRGNQRNWNNQKS
ncbi:ribonuclease H-like domain-containing protein [Tanacetum coccineum]